MANRPDPRVFLATERTLLAWIRTEVALLAFAFLVKKFGIDESLSELSHRQVEIAVMGLCAVTVMAAILSTIQTGLAIDYLDLEQTPGLFAKILVISIGIVSILVCISMSIVVLLI